MESEVDVRNACLIADALRRATVLIQKALDLLLRILDGNSRVPAVKIVEWTPRSFTFRLLLARSLLRLLRRRLCRADQ
ncbi:hypothetical protein [Sorangium cellulosum]|uniref:hypothetical protein n=1 Tax=Sorangium cellulosum TaxID=56 RepID=UPI0012FFA7C6|nr:hypothetical protein [Sorangium cellulosum]